MSHPQVPRNSNELTAEREALEELVRSEGWGIFIRRVKAEWSGDGYYARMGAALGVDDPILPKVIHRTSKEVLAMIEWPRSRVQNLGGRTE